MDEDEVGGVVVFAAFPLLCIGNVNERGEGVEDVDGGPGVPGSNDPPPMNPNGSLTSAARIWSGVRSVGSPVCSRMCCCSTSELVNLHEPSRRKAFCET